MSARNLIYNHACAIKRIVDKRYEIVVCQQPSRTANHHTKSENLSLLCPMPHFQP
ncbi:MAG: hypothetical protein ACHBN1_11225 [Heteroscytonema crispum UTEX LB 1556]